jgi:hypothetical protein
MEQTTFFGQLLKPWSVPISPYYKTVICLHFRTYSDA